MPVIVRGGGAGGLGTVKSIMTGIFPATETSSIAIPNDINLDKSIAFPSSFIGGGPSIYLFLARRYVFIDQPARRLYFSNTAFDEGASSAAGYTLLEFDGNISTQYGTTELQTGRAAYRDVSLPQQVDVSRSLISVWSETATTGQDANSYYGGTHGVAGDLINSNTLRLYLSPFFTHEVDIANGVTIRWRVLTFG